MVDHYLKLGWNTVILGSDKDSEVAAEIKKTLSEITYGGDMESVLNKIFDKLTWSG